jgi:predicted ATPase
MAERATRLPLGRLPTDAVTDMVQGLFGSRPIPPQLAGIIARRTDGVPLFVEAVTRSLLLLPSLPEFDDGPFAIADTAIPASLRESLMARLDRSGRGKEVAQIAAVVGRSVRRDVLAEAARLPDAELEHALAILAEADVLFPDEADGVGTYTFTHALLRDAAYDSLLRDDRKMLHQRVARALQRLDPHTLQQQPELFALHLTEAGLAEEAAPYWLDAARRSLARSALTEATRLLHRGLAALEHLPPVRSNLNLRLQLSALLGPALIGLKGPAAAETQELYGAAYEMCREVPEEPSHFPIYWGWWRVSQDYHAQLARSRAVLERAVDRRHPEFMLEAHHCNWASHYHAGDFARCCEHIDAGLEIYQTGDYRHHAPLYGNHDARVCALGERAQVRWMQGRLRSALDDERASILWSEKLEHLGSRVHAMDFGLLHRVYRRDYRDVFRRAGELVSLTSEYQLDDHRGKGLVFRGWTIAMQEDPRAGLQTLQEGLARQYDTNTSDDFPIYVCLLAEALAACSKPDEAADELTRARANFEKLGLRVWHSEVLRMLGEMTLASEPARLPEAERLFIEAAQVAKQQQVPMLGLRVAMSQARLYAGQGETSLAAQTLVRAIDAIAEDDGSFEMIAARQLASMLSDQVALARAAPGLAIP